MSRPVWQLICVSGWVYTRGYVTSSVFCSLGLLNIFLIRFTNAPHKVLIIRSLGPRPLKYHWWYIDLLTIHNIHSHNICGCSGIIMLQTAERSTRNLQTVITASTTHRPNVGPMSGRRRRLWANIGSICRICWDDSTQLQVTPHVGPYTDTTDHSGINFIEYIGLLNL